MNEIEKVETVKRLCKESLFFLSTSFLGYKDWDKVHDDVERFLMKPARRKALLLPRGHLKSTLVTVAYSIQSMLRDPDVRVLIANGVWDMSRRFLSEIKGQLETSQLRNLFGNFRSERWNQDDAIVMQRGKPRKEPTYQTTGVEAEQTGGHFDLIILDDLTGLQNSQTPEQREKTKRYRRSMINLLEPGGTLIEIGCLVAGTKVLRADGVWKNIEEFKVGEKVLSHDSIETVEAMIPQGVADVYEVKSKNFKIEATGNHPFLTRDRGFVRLEDLKVGEKVIVLNSFDVGGNGVSCEEAWMLGFMLGDGWITRHPNNKGSMRWVTCFAKGVDEKLNQRALGFFKSKFGIEPKLTRFGYYRTEVAKVGRYFESIGLVGKAKTKRVPEWMFGKNNKIKNAFIDGFIDADGTNVLGYNGTVVPSAFEISNKEMASEIKYLATSSGRKSSNIYSRTRMIKAPNSICPVMSETYHVGIGTRLNNERWREVTIQSIEPKGKKEVFDLTVSNTHNFVANGYVVHNTRWHLDDTFSVIFENEMKYYDVMVRKVVEDGKIIFPKHFSKRFDAIRKDWVAEPGKNCMDYVEHLKGSMPIDEFNAQYMNDPVSVENQTFKGEMFKYWTKRPDGLYLAMAVDLAISTSASADYTAMSVLGMDKEWNIYVLDYLRGKWSVSEIINNIFDMQGRWKPQALGMEVNGFQRTLKMAVEEEQRKRRQYFGVEEIRSGPERSKESKIKAMEPFYRQGKVHHAQWMKGKEVETELLTFPKGRHDDLIDSMAMALPFLSPGVDTRENICKPGTYDYILKEAHQAMNRANWMKRYDVYR